MLNYLVIHHSIGSVAHRTNSFACVVTFAAKRLAALRTIIYVFALDFLSAFRTNHIFLLFPFEIVNACFPTPFNAARRLIPHFKLYIDYSHQNRFLIAIMPLKRLYLDWPFALRLNLTQSLKSSINRFVIFSLAFFGRKQYQVRTSQISNAGLKILFFALLHSDFIHLVKRTFCNTI